MKEAFVRRSVDYSRKTISTRMFRAQLSGVSVCTSTVELCQQSENLETDSLFPTSCGSRLFALHFVISLQIDAFLFVLSTPMDDLYLGWLNRRFINEKVVQKGIEPGTIGYKSLSLAITPRRSPNDTFLCIRSSN